MMPSLRVLCYYMHRNFSGDEVSNVLYTKSQGGEQLFQNTTQHPSLLPNSSNV
jgi:hypothetical protein